MEELIITITTVLKVLLYLINIYFGTSLSKFEDDDEPEAARITRSLGVFMIFVSIICLIEIIK